LGGVIRWTVYATGIFSLLELNQHTYLPVVNAEFDICVISCGKEWWRFRLVDVKSDERQEGMVARTAYRLNQFNGDC
jgi:hypothetical protein